MENTAHSFTEAAEYTPENNPPKKNNLSELTLKQRGLNAMYNLIILVTSMVITSYILMVLWSWLAPALNMPVLTFAETLTFIIFIKLLTLKLPRDYKEKLEKKESTKEFFVRRLYILTIQLLGMALASAALHFL